MKKLKLSSDCVVTEGYLMTTILDLRRQKYYSIPTQLNFIENDELHESLMTEEILLDLPNIEILPLVGRHETPSLLDILLIENYFDIHTIRGVINRFFINRIGIIVDINCLEQFEETLKYLVLFDLEVVEVFIQIENAKGNTVDQIKNLIDQFPLLFFNVFTTTQPELFDNLTQVRVINRLFTYTWRSGRDSLFVNFDFYFEALEFNVAFNKRLFLDQTGVFFESFHRQVDLGSDFEQLNLTGLQDIWKSEKSSVDVCKSCELRTMCLDFRFPHKRDENSWYFKEECHYNPYISKWSHEDDYRTLIECGVISDEKDFSIDHEKIAMINNELWGDE